MMLPQIPMLDVGSDWPFETLEREFKRINVMLDEGSGRIPTLAMKIADVVSRRWLERSHYPYLQEIERISARIGRPGAYFLNLSYEWGCTSWAGPSLDGGSSRLVRVLDWPDRGLGRHIIAARVTCGVGDWLTLTWPGYTGVLQALAPGRFAAALNQGPMEQPVGVYLLDWLVNRSKVWKRSHLTPAHLLRRVFEGARDFAEAKAMLSQTPIALGSRPARAATGWAGRGAPVRGRARSDRIDIEHHRRVAALLSDVSEEERSPGKLQELGLEMERGDTWHRTPGKMETK